MIWPDDFINKILLGDCLEIIKSIPGNSIDMIITDPPYGHNNNNGDLIANREKALGRHNENVNDKARPILNDGKEAEEIYEQMIIEAKRILKPDGSCCCCGGGGGPDPMFARWSLVMDKYLTFKQMVVWDKGPIGMGWHYRRSYETVLVGHKGPNCKWYDESSQIENIIRPRFRGIKKIIPSKDEHPTEKPEGLASFFINLHTQEGDLVLDPFCGSGSFIRACKDLKRNFIGIDLDPKWVSRTRERLRQEILI